jgi:tRNA pseudouridine13 synthase
MDFNALRVLPQWPRFLGPPLATGELRTHPEDFRVDELPQVSPSGEGDHLWVQVTKRGANTDWIAGQLALAAGCAARDVGYAGLKDRHAVTTQWFSIPMAATREPPWQEWQIPEATIIQAVRHQKKLKRGVLTGNRFSIVVRNIQGDAGELSQRLEQVRLRGLPNYFGPQRFGHAGDNAWKGARWLVEGGRLPRAKRSIYLSAVRSFLFNEVLAQRVYQGSWDQLLEGDVVMLNGTHSVFLCDAVDPQQVQRCREFDLHPTGPLPGNGGFSPLGVAAQLEASVLEPHRELIAVLCKARVDADRRSLRLRVESMLWQFHGSELHLDFALPPGSYATTVMDELVSTADGTHVRN